MLVILIFSLHIQNQIKPFKLYELNQMEIRAILVAFVTIYCGMYYLTDELNDASKIILFIVMLLANLYFLVYWCVKMGGAGMNIVREKVSCLKRIIRANKIEDGYDDSLTVNTHFTDKIKVINSRKSIYQMSKLYDRYEENSP